MADVFISYERASQPVAKRLAGRLTALGFSVWWDEQIPAHRAYAEVIEERLRDSACVIVLWSQAAVKSQWVRAEADIARNAGKLVQAVIDDCAPPIPFDQLQRADLKSWTGGANHPGWRKIEASVRALTGPVTDAPPPTATRPAPSRRLSPPLLLGLAAALLAVTLGGWWLLNRTRDLESADAGVAVRPLAVSDPSLKALAASIDDQIVGVMTAKGMAPLPASNDAKASVVVEGRVQALEGKVQVALRVSTGRDHVPLWSTSFERPAGAVEGFPEQVSAKISDIMACVVHSAAPGLHLKTGVRSLYLHMCDLQRTDRYDEVFDIAHQIEQQAPDFRLPMGDVAIAGALSLRRLSPEQAARVRTEATAAADGLLKANPKDPGADLAKSLLVLPRGDWLTRERWLDRGLQDHDDATLDNYKADILQQVGRLGEALRLNQRGVILDPKSAPKAMSLVSDLALNGDLTSARSQLDHFIQTWPNDPESLFAAFKLSAFSDTAQSLRLLENPETRPEGFTDDGVDIWRAFAKAKSSRAPADITRAGTLLAGALDGPASLNRGIVVRALLAMGRADEVEAFFRRRAADDRVDSSLLFSPEAAAYRRDPRFMRLAHDIGLAAYWKASGKWPDFCADATLPYRCQDLAK